MYWGEHYDTIKSSNSYCDCILSTPVLKGKKSSTLFHSPDNPQPGVIHVSPTLPHPEVYHQNVPVLNSLDKHAANTCLVTHKVEKRKIMYGF